MALYVVVSILNVIHWAIGLINISCYVLFYPRIIVFSLNASVSCLHYC